MLDRKDFETDPDAMKVALAARLGGSADRVVENLLEAMEDRRVTITHQQALESEKKAISKEIGSWYSQIPAGESHPVLEALRQRSGQLTKGIEDAKASVQRYSQTVDGFLSRFPNLAAPDVPVGDETANLEVVLWGTPRQIDAPKDHVEIGANLGMLDFDGAAKVSGAGFAVLRGPLARMERALADFMMDMNAQYGFEETSPPHIVTGQALYGTGQLPKFEKDLYAIEDDDLFLIPTAEVSLTNLVRDTLYQNADAFPMRMQAHTPCYRREAGGAGRADKGLIRQHQFDKVELVTVCTPDQVELAHNQMIAAAESILQALELPYRRVLLSTGDMGFSARKTYDLEVWLPSQNTYREIASISDCGDFQARRMNARYRDADGKPQYLHTLNGSSLAVGRTLVAILENFQEPDGSVVIPKPLRRYMRGLKRLAPAVQPDIVVWHHHYFPEGRDVFSEDVTGRFDAIELQDGRFCVYSADLNQIVEWADDRAAACRRAIWHAGTGE